MKFKKKTKKFRGGLDNRLNESVIIFNLKDILNERPLKYKFDINKLIIFGQEEYQVFILNSDEESIKYNHNKDPCVTFQIIRLKEGYSLFIDVIYKCAPISNYGNFILDCFKRFGEKLDYYSLIISSDASKLEFYINNKGKSKYINIDLANLNILSTGETWYNRQGFYASSNIDEKQINLAKIRQDIEDIDDQEKIINVLENENKNICKQIINTYGKFKELFNFILKLTNKIGTNSVQEVFKSISGIIKDNCNSVNRTCTLEYETMLKISCFINIIYNLLDIEYKVTALIYVLPKKGGKNKRKSNKNKTKKI